MYTIAITALSSSVNETLTELKKSRYSRHAPRKPYISRAKKASLIDLPYDGAHESHKMLKYICSLEWEQGVKPNTLGVV